MTATPPPGLSTAAAVRSQASNMPYAITCATAFSASGVALSRGELNGGFMMT